MPVHWYVAGCNRISGLTGFMLKKSGGFMLAREVELWGRRGFTLMDSGCFMMVQIKIKLFRFGPGRANEKKSGLVWAFGNQLQKIQIFLPMPPTHTHTGRRVKNEVGSPPVRLQRMCSRIKKKQRQGRTAFCPSFEASNAPVHVTAPSLPAMPCGTCNTRVSPPVVPPQRLATMQPPHRWLSAPPPRRCSRDKGTSASGTALARSGTAIVSKQIEWHAPAAAVAWPFSPVEVPIRQQFGSDSRQAGFKARQCRLPLHPPPPLYPSIGGASAVPPCRATCLVFSAPAFKCVLQNSSIIDSHILFPDRQRPPPRATSCVNRHNDAPPRTSRGIVIDSATIPPHGTKPAPVLRRGFHIAVRDGVLVALCGTDYGASLSIRVCCHIALASCACRSFYPPMAKCLRDHPSLS
jgi:hypothetical protein